MKRALILAILFFFFHVLQIHAQTGAFKGVIRDSTDKNTIAYASVSLLDNNLQVIAGQVTDKDGRFSFPKLSTGSYALIIKFIGYDQKKITELYVDNKQIDIGIVYLKGHDQLLDEVQVAGKVAMQQHKIDRQVYQAAQFQNAVGGTALDIVKNLPAVSVDGQGNISIRGYSGFLVLINDKPVVLDASTFLQQIAANDVLEVEYITSPSAKYDPDGKGGILNIKTKKATADGLVWLLNMQAGLPSTGDYDNVAAQKRYGGDLSLYYRKGKFDFSGSANYLRNDNAGFREGDVYTIIDNKQTFFPSAGERSFDKYNYGVRLNTSYQISESQQLDLGLLASRKFQDRLADIYYNNRAVDIQSGQELYRLDYFNSNLQTKQGEFYLLDLSYKLKVDKHDFQVGLIYEHANIYGGTANSNIVSQNDTTQFTQNTYRNPLDGLRLNVLYGLKWGMGKLESGYQFRTDKQRGTFDYLSREGYGPLVVIPEFSGRLNATNQVHALYSQYDWKRAAVSFNLGLRYEYYERQLNLLHTGESHPYSIHQLYPSFSLLYELDNNWSWKVAASRRVQRNNNFELNPIPEREHSETLEQGDPELLSEFVTAVETGLVKKLGKGSLFANLYYQHMKNPIQRVNAVYADTVLNRVFTNADRATRVGLEIGGDMKPLSWLQLNLGSNIYQYAVEGTVLNYSNYHKNKDLVYVVNVGNQVLFSPTWSMAMNVNYTSKRPTVQGWDSRFITPHLSIKKTFYKGAFSAQLQWQNIELGNWGVNEQRITTTGNDFYTTTNYVYEKNILLLNLNLNLHKLNKVLKLPKSEFGEKEF